MMYLFLNLWKISVNSDNLDEENEIEILESNKEEIKPHQVSLLEIDDRLREIDDFLK